MLTVLGQNAVTKQPVLNLSIAFRNFVALPPDLQKLKVVIRFPKMTSKFSHHM